MKKQLLFILLFLPAFLTAKEIRYFVQPGEILDLSENAFERHGIKVSEIDSVSMSGSFTFSIKVRSHARELGEKALITNKKNNIPNEAGIWIGTQDNGSWIVHFCDGKNTPWEYRPTALRQPINDDKWHTLTVTHDAGKQEMRMYYDQLNVAIYCTNGNVNLATNNTLRIGSVDDGQWNAFNGYIKEFTFISHVELPKISVTDTQCLSQLKVMAFNIFHGGHELGQEVGVNRVVEVIKAENPDVIGMVETYGSGAIIADALGYYFYLRSSNLSIMSRYPITDTYDLYDSFNCSAAETYGSGAIIADALGYYFYLRSSNLSIMSRYPITDTYDLYDSFNCSAATLQISPSQQINYINLWLDYRPITNDQINACESIENIIAGEWSRRAAQLQSILKAFPPQWNTMETPLIVSGDFNSDSHLDWKDDTKNMNGHNGYVIEWPTSKLMEKAHFIDSYREIHPDVKKYPCLTWSTMAKNELQYRIDFIYYKGKDIKAIQSEMIDKHPVRYPSDHAAVVTTFNLK